MNINTIYKEYTKGLITESQFMQQVRIQPGVKSMISSGMSFKDAVKVFVNKGILEECSCSEEDGLEELDVTPLSNPDDAENYAGFNIPDTAELGEVNKDHLVRLATDIHKYKPSIYPKFKEIIQPFLTTGRDDDNVILSKILMLLSHNELDLSPNWTIAMQPELNEGKDVPKIKPQLPLPDGEISVPDQITQEELRRGVKFEMLKGKNRIQATKTAITNIEKDYLYYSRKERYYEKTAKKSADLYVDATKKNLIDKSNQMVKIKKKVINESLETDFSSKVKEYISSNPVLRHIASDIQVIADSDTECTLQYKHWEPLPNECLAKLELQFEVEVDKNEEGAGNACYYLKTRGSSDERDLGNSFDKFKGKLGEIVQECLDEMYGSTQELKDPPALFQQEKIERIREYGKAAKLNDYEALAATSFAEENYYKGENDEYFLKIRERFGINEQAFQEALNNYRQETANDEDDFPVDDDLSQPPPELAIATPEPEKKTLKEDEEEPNKIEVGATFKLSVKIGKFEANEAVTVTKIEREGDDIRVDIKNAEGKEDSFYIDPNDTLDID